jgi:hypothetical protein
MLFDDAREQGLFGPVVLVTTNRPVSLGIPCHGGERYDSRPCDTVTSYSLSPWPQIMKANH